MAKKLGKLEGRKVSVYLLPSKAIYYTVMSQNIDYNVMCRWQGERKEEVESDKKRILTNRVS